MKNHEVFDKISGSYAASRPVYPRSLFEYINSLCEKHDAVWDCACGNGQASIALADYFNDVYATDVSENQISSAIKNERVHYSVQPAEATGFGDSFFDAVCVATALHWFDYNTFWPEVQRVLKKGGIFAAWSYSWFSIDRGIDEIISSMVLSELAPYWSPRNKLLWNQYKDIRMPFKQLQPPQISMNMEWNLNELFAYIKTWSATALCIQDKGESFFYNAYEAVIRHWGAPESKKNISMNFFIIAGRKD